MSQIFHTIGTIGGRVGNFFTSGKRKAEEIGQDLATVIQEAAYITLFVNALKVAPLASTVINGFSFAMNSAAAFSNGIELKNSFFTLFYPSKKPSDTDTAEKSSDQEFLTDERNLEYVRIIKTVFHLAVDVMGILGAFFASMSLSLPIIISLLSISAFAWAYLQIMGSDIKKRKTASAAVGPLS